MGWSRNLTLISNETLMMDAMMDNFENMGLFNYTDISKDDINVLEEVV